MQKKESAYFHCTAPLAQFFLPESLLVEVLASNGLLRAKPILPLTAEITLYC